MLENLLDSYSDHVVPMHAFEKHLFPALTTNSTHKEVEEFVEKGRFKTKRQ